jgi:hypothetical protein
MSTKMPRGQVTGDGSYLFLEWLDTISRYKVVLRLTNSTIKK